MNKVSIIGLGKLGSPLAACFAEKGFRILGLDARADNIHAAAQRCSGIQFVVSNIEDAKPENLGQFDMILCTGLLYHLENPLLAIRNFYALAKKFLVIEPMIIHESLPMAALVSEKDERDQAIQGVAFVASEQGLIKMLYRAGFFKSLSYEPTSFSF